MKPLNAHQNMVLDAPTYEPDGFGPGYGYGSHSGGIDIWAIWTIIRRNLLLIISIIVTVVIIGLVATMLTTPRYTALASIQINQAADQVLENQDVQAPDAIQDADRFLQTQTDLLKSRAMIIRVAQRMNLFNNEGFYTKMGVRPPDNTDKKLSSNEIRESVIKLISDHLAVSLPRNSRIAAISFVSPDPKFAASMANTFADEFIKANLERRFESTGYAREFLSRQLSDAKQKLETSERALNDYARSAGLIRTVAPGDTGGQNGGQASTSITTASLIQLNTAANAARDARIAAEEKWNAISKVSLLSIPDVLANQAFQTLIAQKAQAEADLQSELSKHLESHPSVIVLRARVRDIDQQINSLARGIRDSIRNQYESARLREQELIQQVNNYKAATLDEQDRGVRYNILAREADTNRTLYEGLLQRYKEVSAASGITVNNISIVDQADVPIQPTSPRLFLNLALAGMLGLALAAGVVFLREQLDDVIRSPDDVENKLGLHLLGVIPETSNADIREQLLNPRSTLAEGYNALRTSLIYSSTTGLPHVILLTSSQPGEGKSTSAYALANSLAKLGKRTCLIEADLRRPMMATFLGVDVKGRGLTALLTSDSDIRPAIMETDQSNLSVVCAGAMPPGPTELLGSPRFLQVLEEFRELFDVIILDGPPVLGLADAPILSSIADATVYVVEANRPHRGAAKTAVRRLRTANSNLIGAVLTKFNPEKAGSGYNYYGYNYYNYGHGHEE